MPTPQEYLAEAQFLLHVSHEDMSPEAKRSVAAMSQAASAIAATQLAAPADLVEQANEIYEERKAEFEKQREEDLARLGIPRRGDDIESLLALQRDSGSRS